MAKQRVRKYSDKYLVARLLLREAALVFADKGTTSASSDLERAAVAFASAVAMEEVRAFEFARSAALLAGG